MTHFFFLLAVLFVSVETMAFGETEKQIGMIRDLETIRGIFADHYAPADWKNESLGWDLNAEFDKAKTRVLEKESLTTKEYQQILLDFFNSPKDHHVVIYFNSTEIAELPFNIKSAEGRYFFVHIDKDKLSPAVYPIEEGDELVLFDGKPVAEVIQKIKKYHLGGNPATEDALAEMRLTVRLGMLGHEVPKGPIQIQVSHAASNKVANYQLMWGYTPEKITSRFGSYSERDDQYPTQLTPLLKQSFFNKKMISPIYHACKANHSNADSKHFLGTKKSFVPQLGKIWWSAPAQSRFHAYLFETKDRRLVGYVRIPTYLGDERNVDDFADIIDFFEMRADALVIDQVDNPGGLLFYTYAIASMLTDQPLITPKHRVKLSQSDVFFAHMAIPMLESIQSDADARFLLGETREGNEVTFQMAQFFLNYLYFLVDEWNAGRQFTNPTHLEGIDHIHPNPNTQFTKPILFLTNSMDLSCGDFLPAILQDNKRATIFGERTGGAGGYITTASFPNLNGIMGFSLTASIAERKDLIPLENLGVTPDIPYSLTAYDLQNGYQEYKAAVLNAVGDLLDFNKTLE